MNGDLIIAWVAMDLRKIETVILIEIIIKELKLATKIKLRWANPNNGVA